MELNCWSLLIQSLIAVGTIAVAIIAIWGNYFRYKIVPPKLNIEASNLRGTLTRLTTGQRVIYYHLKVVNARPWSSAKNCHVVLRSISKRLANGTFKNVPLPVCPSFIWSPAQITPPIIDLTYEQTIDFGNIVEGDDKYSPVLNFYSGDFEGFVKQDECLRYSLEINTEGYKNAKLYVFEVAWNGQWSDNLDTMSAFLTIREIK